MKNHLYKTALAVGLGLAGATAAHAQNPNANDLVLGFTSQFSGVTSDYLIDLGQIPSSPGVLTTSFSPTTFGNTFTTSSGNALTSGALNVGIVGGSSSDAIFSELDGSATPLTTIAGSATPASDSRAALDNGGEIATGLTLGTTLQSSSTSFFSDVAENPNAGGASANNFTGYVDNPLTTINGTSESVVLDLWEDANSGRTGVSGWTYEGYVDLSLSGGNLTATFDEGVNAVPEPATYGLFGLGVLLFGLRRYLTSKPA
jgi:hypothetical protein